VEVLKQKRRESSLRVPPKCRSTSGVSGGALPLSPFRWLFRKRWEIGPSLLRGRRYVFKGGRNFFRAGGGGGSSFYGYVCLLPIGGGAVGSMKDRRGGRTGRRGSLPCGVGTGRGGGGAVGCCDSPGGRVSRRLARFGGVGIGVLLQ